MTRLTVLHVIEAMHQGGAESMVVEHVRHAGPLVCSIVVALNRGGPALEQVERAGARVQVLGRPRGGPLGRLARVFTLARLMRRERVTVVNAHNPSGALYALPAAGLAGVPVRIWTEHSVHYRGRHSRLYAALESWLVAGASRIVCVCEAVRQSHAPRHPRHAARFVVVPNGISDAMPVDAWSASRARARAALGIEGRGPVVLAVGSLTPQKDHATLLEAFGRAAASAPDARLWIAGEGAGRGALEVRRDALGLGATVRLLGARDDVPALLEAADVFVLSSVREGLSVTLLEAMRAGRASVVTRVGGNGEAVEEGVTGFIVPPRNPAPLSRALGQLLTDSALRMTLGRAARACWERRFTAARMVADTERLYRAALARRDRAARGARAPRAGKPADAQRAPA